MRFELANTENVQSKDPVCALARHEELHNKRIQSSEHVITHLQKRARYLVLRSDLKAKQNRSSLHEAGVDFADVFRDRARCMETFVYMQLTLFNN